MAQQPEPHQTQGTRPTSRWTSAGPIRTVEPTEEVLRQETHAAATAADAAPLGLAGFAGATFTVSAINAGWAPAVALVAALPILFIFGGLTQFIAGMWAFRKGNTFAATAFGSFGAFNTLFAIVLLIGFTGLVPFGTTAMAVAGGLTLAMFGLIAAYLAVAAIAESWVLVAVLTTLAVTYGLLSAGWFAGGGLANGLIYAGGWAGIVSSSLAFWASLAIVINSTMHRQLIPY
ncbi:MAG: acetate uptake transporter [Chloroflexota bacterium]